MSIDDPRYGKYSYSIDKQQILILSLFRDSNNFDKIIVYTECFEYSDRFGLAFAHATNHRSYDTNQN
jgi:hypothetical protein